VFPIVGALDKIDDVDFVMGAERSLEKYVAAHGWDSIAYIVVV
jgi:hypothetical protein